MFVLPCDWTTSVPTLRNDRASALKARIGVYPDLVAINPVVARDRSCANMRGIDMNVNDFLVEAALRNPDSVWMMKSPGRLAGMLLLLALGGCSSSGGATTDGAADATALDDLGGFPTCTATGGATVGLLSASAFCMNYLAT
jgi:hypothetical protein